MKRVATGVGEDEGNYGIMRAYFVMMNIDELPVVCLTVIE